MNNWQRWVKSPHTLWLRRALFQVHLWMGIGFGLYVLLISVSGSAIVLRPQVFQWFVHDRVDDTVGEALSGPALETRVAEVYAGFDVVEVRTSSRPGRAGYVMLVREGEEQSRFFDQYTGQDLGSTFPWPVALVEWLTDLHDNLLMERFGRKVNGIGGMIFLLMVVSGLIIWWQGKARWKEGLTINRNRSRGFMWQLHSVLGIWSLVLMFSWGLTAVYFGFPEPFDFIIDIFDNDLSDFERPEGWLLVLIDLHFGRFGGMWSRVTWIILGFLPAVMFYTGFTLWWRRVVKKRLHSD